MVKRISNKFLAFLFREDDRAVSASQGSPAEAVIGPMPVAVRFDISLKAGGRTIPASQFLWVSPARSHRSLKALEVIILSN